MITVTDNLPSVSARLQAKTEIMRVRLVAKINSLSTRLQQKMLTRPGSPMSSEHRKKGWLANSVHPIPAVIEGGTISGGVAGAGGDAWYGRLFEDGTFTPYTITATRKALMFEAHGMTVFVRQVVHPPFNPLKLATMRPSFEEFRSTIMAEIREEVLAALR